MSPVRGNQVLEYLLHIENFAADYIVCLAAVNGGALYLVAGSREAVACTEFDPFS